MSAQNDPFALYRIAKQGVSAPISAPDPFEKDENDPFNEYRIKPPETTEYTLKDIPRITGGNLVRATETATGAPGTFQKGFGGLLDLIIGAPTEYFTGKEQPKLRNFLRDPLSSLGKHRETAEEIEKDMTGPGESSIFTQYPSSEELRENVTKPASKQYLGEEEFLEPKNEAEKFGQEFTQDLVNLSLPGSGIQSWPARIGLSLAGNTSKEVAKQLGFSPSTQELAKLGTLGIVSLAQIGNAPQYARQYFQQTKAMMPRGIRFNSNPTQQNLNKIKNSQWYRGHTTPSTKAAREMIDAVEQRIQGGTLSAHDAMTLRENINELANNLGAFQVEKTGKTTHVARLNEVRDALLDGMEQTLGRQYPNWWKQYQDTNQAFAITQRSSALGNFIAHNYAKPIVSDAGKILFGNALAKGAAGVAKLGIAGAGIASGAKLIELTNRLSRSPTLRRYYQNVINTAVQNDALAMAHALEKFDKAAIKEEKEGKAKKVLRNPRQK